MSDAQRLDAWATAWRALRAAPGRALTFGWGPETFQAVYRLHRTQAAADLIGYDRVADHAHNLPLELLVTLGAIGAATFAYLFWHLWREGDDEARAAMLGLGVVAMVEPVFFPPAALLFLLLGSRRRTLTAVPVMGPILAAAACTFVAAAMWVLDLRGYQGHALALHPHESEALQIEVLRNLNEPGGNLDLAVFYAHLAAQSDPMHRPLIEQAVSLDAAVTAREREPETGQEPRPPSAR